MNAELAALLASAKETPGDPAPMLVIADWLDEHGEPDRARLLRLVHHPDYRWHGAGEPLRLQAQTLIAEHGWRWWGEGQIGLQITRNLGLLGVGVRAGRLLSGDMPPALLDAWRQGWVAHLKVHQPAGRWAELAATPLLAGIVSLDLSVPDWDDDYLPDDSAAFALAGSPFLRSLCGLYLGESRVTEAGELALMESPNLPRLAELQFFGW